MITSMVNVVWYLQHNTNTNTITYISNSMYMYNKHEYTSIYYFISITPYLFFLRDIIFEM